MLQEFRVTNYWKHGKTDSNGNLANYNLSGQDKL